MAMSATSMAARIEANIAAIPPVQGSTSGPANTYRHQVLIAMCQGIIDEIKAGAVVTTPVVGVQTGASTVTSTGTVTS